MSAVLARVLEFSILISIQVILKYVIGRLHFEENVLICVTDQR